MMPPILTTPNIHKIEPVIELQISSWPHQQSWYWCSY